MSTVCVYTRQTTQRTRYRAYRTLELPRLPIYLQGDTWNNLSRDENTASEMVSRYLTDGKCEEKSLKLSTRTRLRAEAEKSWRVMMAIRAEMGKDNVLLQGIVEADETYIGGKRKKDYDKEGGVPRKRGRGTAKDVVLGAVSRGGKVVAELVEDVKGSTIAAFIKKFVKTDASELYTDQYKGYNSIGKEMKHETMNRSQKWEPCGIHTNTMEGFWSCVKRAWYGSHHHYSTRYTPLYLAEACYKYNYRDENMFAKLINGCFR